MSLATAEDMLERLLDELSHRVSSRRRDAATDELAGYCEEIERVIDAVLQTLDAGQDHRGRIHVLERRAAQLRHDYGLQRLH